MFYKTPVHIEDNLSFQRESESIRESIDTFLELLIFTPRGGFKADYDFGFEFWSNEFQNIVIEDFNQHINESVLVNRRGDSTDQRNCIRNLKKAIEMYEPRLQNVKIEMNLKQKDNTQKSYLRNEVEDHTKYDVFLTIRGDIYLGMGNTEGFMKQVTFAVGPAFKK